MWPRNYANQIIQLTTLQERRAALLKVPEEWQALVRTHLQIAWNHPARQHNDGATP